MLIIYSKVFYMHYNEIYFTNLLWKLNLRFTAAWKKSPHSALHIQSCVNVHFDSLTPQKYQLWHAEINLWCRGEKYAVLLITTMYSSAAQYIMQGGIRANNDPGGVI